MTVYTVQRQDKFDYDCSAELVNLGCYLYIEKAIARAEQEYEVMQCEYEDEISQYSNADIYDPEEYGSGALYVEEDNENGFYVITFGADDKCETHCVWVDEWEVQ
jgi:hypothetical protein